MIQDPEMSRRNKALGHPLMDVGDDSADAHAGYLESQQPSRLPFIATILLFLAFAGSVVYSIIYITQDHEDGNKDWERRACMTIGVSTGLLAMTVAAWLAHKVIIVQPGNARMQEIALAIEQGSKTFLHREYTALAFFVIPTAGAIGALTGNWQTALCFVAGCIVSASTGYVGMHVAVKANVRTATVAQQGLNPALRVAFNSGSVMGLCVVGFGVLAISLLFLVLVQDDDDVDYLAGFAFGASSIALFARVGGGIYTKAADVGTDLVGKVEAGIPEDDPRNPGVIADNVGDNVGDVAGMGADLFESYASSIISTMTVGMTQLASDKEVENIGGTAVGMPILLACVGIVGSVIGTQLVRTKDNATQGDLLQSIRRATFFSAAFFAAGSVPLFLALGFSIKAWGAMIFGLVAGVLIGLITEYYTSYDFRPTQQISESGITGSATVIIQGLGVGLESTCLPVLCTVASIYGSLRLYGAYGVSISAVGMLSTLGITLATDAYGPVADNAGGIAEMAHMPPEIRQRTDSLDALGNTTAAVGKGFSAGSAMLTALALLQSFIEKALPVDENGEDQSSINLTKHESFIPALLIGGMLPFLFSSMTMLAVGKSAGAIINEVRRQFRMIPGLMEGNARADYERCVDISTSAALREMIMPGAITVLPPVMIGLTFGPHACIGMLMGATVSGSMLSLTMNNAGGAWDNAKKYVEGYPDTQTVLGGKGTDLHKATVAGDTVGDPFKDTAGPSLGILLKLMSVVCLVLAKPIRDQKYWHGLVATGACAVIFLILYWIVRRLGGGDNPHLAFVEAARQRGEINAAEGDRMIDPIDIE